LFVDLHTRAEDSTYEDAILNGIEVFKMSDSDRNLAGPNPPLQDSKGSDQTLNPNTENSKSKKTLLAIALGSGVAGFVVLLSMVFCVVFLRLRKEKRYHGSSKRRSSRSTKTSSGRLPEQVCRCFSLAEIKMATNNFDQVLVIGRGGFGYVYKGHLADEVSTVVAIKRLNKGLSGQGEKEFEAEIKMLSQLRHVHLVSLIGYCDDDDEMILVYDYMANGTLRDHLYGTDNDPLPWKQRLEICVGAARGLHYLHSEVKNTVIHRDVKTTNILLDEKWVSKVADFGLSKLGRGDSAVSTAVKGTFGYMDPEYAQSRQLTDKSDVYSFGVVLFEVLCARKPVDIKLEEDQRNLAQWARKSIKEGRIQNIIDPYLIGKIAPECFKKFVEVAERCVRDYWSQRPTMHEVMENLEFVLELQEQADATQLGNNPDGRCSYPEKLSFHLVVDNRGFGYDVLGLRSGVGVSTTVGSNTAESGVPSLDSESGTREIFSDASISKKTCRYSRCCCFISSLTILILLGCTIFCRRRRTIQSDEEQKVLYCHRFTLNEIRTATNNFDTDLKIGDGGFGRVCKGFIDGKENPVAVKVLKSTSSQGFREFWTEVETLSKLQNPNLVPLIGYCNDQRFMIIVYDYMAHGTVRDHLYGTNNQPLTWKHRLEICIGPDRGLVYLHAGAEHMIIHRDVKTSNILLDENWVAKVSDFGLSRLGPTSPSRSHISMDVKGTFGYLDLEYFWTKQLTSKSDVYGFGVVMFEVLCGRPAVDMGLEEEQQSLVQWARFNVEKGILDQIIDENLRGQIAPECLKVYGKVTDRCLRSDRKRRPKMDDVLRALEFILRLQEGADSAVEDGIEIGEENKSDENISCWRGGD
ncbi:LOW QUALITY PROTEIN: receptor-like protein kinase FERONIA, partial [Morus notabilis]|uniref:LOW QUALITY PROTEIN: receptor-like protein kinase FERONIA n=1 Tax=Morus notabilis TaxID=981085 RepID=UPI000CED3936